MNIRLHEDPLALTLPPQPADPRRRAVGTLRLDESAVDGFNALLAELEPDAPRISADQLVTLARWLQDQPGERAEAILAERLARADQLRRMLDDGDWTVDPRTRERACRLLDYLRLVDDLIPDDQPLVGQLDDALLVELSWRSFDGATIDYGDYCRFRAAARPGGDAGERVRAWENDCLAQAALLIQRRQVRATRYAHGGDLPERFRVG
jgi:uncharacterized membrane protein YkvA (DUF1232 family)